MHKIRQRYYSTFELILLALLFAHPFIRQSTPQQRGDRLTVVAVDRSFSMRTREGSTTRLDLAKDEALKVLGSVPGGTKAQVVALSGILEAMTQQVSDPNELRAAISAIKEGDSRADFGVLARYLRTLREQADIPLEVHLISDLQKSGQPAGFADLRLDDGTKLVLEVAQHLGEVVLHQERFEFVHGQRRMALRTRP